MDSLDDYILREAHAKAQYVLRNWKLKKLQKKELERMKLLEQAVQILEVLLLGK